MKQLEQIEASKDRNKGKKLVRKIVFDNEEEEEEERQQGPQL